MGIRSFFRRLLPSGADFFIELFGYLQKRPSCSKANNTKKYSSKKLETIKIRDLKDTIVGCLPNQRDEFP